jgi:hypothetical protein
MRPDIEWIAGLLDHRGIPIEMLDRLLDSFRSASLAHLDDRGKILTEYLAELIRGRTA